MENLSKLTKLRARHFVKYDGINFVRRKDTDLTQYTNVDDVALKRASADTLEGAANRLLLEAERKEQAEDKQQAKRYDRSYVERGDYSIMTLYSDFKTEIEDGRKTWTDYQDERKKWRRCVYKFCINMFPVDKENFIGKRARRKDSRYCCEDCKKRDYTIKRRFERTGSYLPVYEIIDSQTDSMNDREREMTDALDEQDLQNNYNEYNEYSIVFKDETVEQVFDNYYKDKLKYRSENAHTI